MNQIKIIVSISKVFKSFFDYGWGIYLEGANNQSRKTKMKLALSRYDAPFKIAYEDATQTAEGYKQGLEKLFRLFDVPVDIELEYKINHEW